MKRKVALHNLGCKVNAYELDAIGEKMVSAGYELVDFAPGADIYVINTCTVTNIADRKSRQMLHKAKKMNPEAIVVATGCYVQTDEEKIEKDEAIDLVVGNDRKGQLVELLEEYEKTCGKVTDVMNINQIHEYEPLSIHKTADHTRAYIKVQDGCNQFCTYCIIPYARGRVRSRKLEDIRQEIGELVENGYQEFVLTGIHLSSYGIDFPENDSMNLLQLILDIHAMEGVRRIRLGSLEPRIITEEFAKTLSELPKMCPHFHLSLQSGCQKTLEAMNRRYTAEEYEEKCRILRKYFTSPALTTDVITGFPGETEEDFMESYEFVKKINFYETHIFKYSMRRGTKAAKMQNQIQESVKALRSEKMLELNEVHRSAYEDAFLGERVNVLLEEQIEIENKIYLVGHSKEYIRVAVLADDNIIPNECYEIKLDKRRDKHTLIGHIETDESPIK